MTDCGRNPPTPWGNRAFYAERGKGNSYLFQEVCAPSRDELAGLLDKIIARLMKLLTRQGYLVEEQGMTYLADMDADNPLASMQAAACTYRIALGPRAGQKVLSRRSLSGSSRTWACLREPPRAHRLGPRLRQAGKLRPSEAIRADAGPGETTREGEFFSKHRAIDRFSGRRYGRAWGKKWFEFPIHLHSSRI